MIDVSKIQSGDRFFVYGGTFLSKAIRYFMRLYAKKKGIPKGWIGSHAGTLFWVDGELFIFESIDKGFRPTVFLDHYGTHDDFMIVRTKDGYSDEQKRTALKYALRLVEISTFYQYWNFIQWPLDIWFNVKAWRWGGQRATYCYESTFRIMAHTTESLPNNPEVISFFDISRQDDVIIIDSRK